LTPKRKVLNLPQTVLSAIWALITLTAALFAGQDALKTGVAIAVVASIQAIAATRIQKRLAQISRSEWRSCVPIAAMLAWVAISGIVIVAAQVSRLGAAILALAALWMTAGRPRRTYPTLATQSISWDRGAYLVAMSAVAVGLFACYPALRAASLGYLEYDRAIWIDAPFHASYIAAHASALIDGEYVDIHGYGLPTQFYHAGVYAMPALIKALSGANALALTQVLTAWSYYWLAIALYAVATCCASRTLVAAVAAIVVMLVPDTGQLPGGHPSFGSHWLLNVAAATGTGLAIALVALATMIHACRQRNWQLILLAWVMALAVVCFKAQLFVAIAVPIFLLPPVLLPGLRWQQRAVMVSLQIALVALVTYFASFSANLPLVRVDFSAGPQWLAAVTPNAPTWASPVLALASTWSPAPQVALYLLLFVAWMFAGWALVWLVVWLLFRDFPKLTDTRFLLGVTVAYVVFVAGLAPDNRNATGGPLEVHLQAQVFGYACFALWAALAVSERPVVRGRTVAAVIGVGAAAIGFVWASAWTQPIQRNTPIKVPTLQLAPDLAALAALRASLDTCDVIFVADGDQFMVWQAALERPIWVADYAFNPKHRPEVMQRINDWTHRTIPLEPWLAARGITLFILPSNTPPSLAEAPTRAPDFDYPHFRAWRIPAQRPCGSR
jgi:hypothetical protein